MFVEIRNDGGLSNQRKEIYAMERARNQRYKIRKHTLRHKCRHKDDSQNDNVKTLLNQYFYGNKHWLIASLNMITACLINNLIL